MTLCWGIMMDDNRQALDIGVCKAQKVVNCSIQTRVPDEVQTTIKHHTLCEYKKTASSTYTCVPIPSFFTLTAFL